MKNKKQVKVESGGMDSVEGAAFAVAEHEADFVRGGEGTVGVLPDLSAARVVDPELPPPRVVDPELPPPRVVDQELPPAFVVDPSVDDDRLFALYVCVLSSMDHLRDIRKEQTRYRHALKMAREALDFYNNNKMEG